MISSHTAPLYGGGVNRATLNNCIVWGNTYSVDGSVNNHTGNGIYYSCMTPLWPGEGNIDADPRFVATNDLHLAWDSPCINTGRNAYAAGLTDFEGNPRIESGTVDMGAYEYSYVAQPVFFPPSGAIITNSLTIAISCPTEGATIRYTQGDSDPTSTSPLYSEAINITTTTTFRACAYKTSMADSPVAVATYYYYRRGTVMLCY